MHYFGSKQELFQRVTHASPAQPLGGTPEQVSEQILAILADSLTNEPVQSLAVLRSMLTHPEAAQVAREGAARYRAQISRSIPAADADTRAALISAIMIGVIVSRHLLTTDSLADAAPEQIVGLLRPCLRSLTLADPSPSGS
jgi:AcrR family transcriptional regulator